jgi:two-component system, OmpR family, alkaline phosphatase synthesis response regulator PhoP
MAKAAILVVEDESDIREIMSHSLEREGYSVTACADAEKGLESIRRARPDLVLLDMMLPGMDGFEALRRIRADKDLRGLPVIMVTARSEDTDIVAGLELGADDYVCKPFSPRVLAARVRARLRETGREEKGAEEGPRSLSALGIEIDPERHECRIAGKPVELSATEFSLLEFLMSNPGRVFSRSRLIDAVRGPDYPVTDRAVDVQVLGLRRKMGDAGELVETVRGVGYRFKDGSR